MDDLKFEWNFDKSVSNIQKHGVSFDEAKTVFTDEYARLIGDPDHSQDEDRFLPLGTSIESNLLVVCHCIREAESIRIISARKAGKQERKIYEDYRYA
ncbi:BrnT family toxin [Marinomonas rhizomae]|uniref:BrnT family toxin n=1 Tax=Marinomonas rhizomae TaxID=491948 RepID=UPI0021041180|nr:BrnT family toxin [Marinomonas rhizomae]UTV98095.1 BrnT family toxin [Marinomonas rhizomae]